MKNENTQDIRKSILEKALPNACFEGWNRGIIEAAAIQAGYTKDMARAVFPSCLDDVLDEFSSLADDCMMREVEDIDIDALKIRECIKTAVLARFKVLDDHKEAVRESLSYWAHPFRQYKGGKILWRTSDKIWNWAGDTSQDYNFYTKRGLLSSILASTTVVWCYDNDSNHQKTEEFLDRRISNVMSFGKFVTCLKSKGRVA